MAGSVKHRDDAANSISSVVIIVVLFFPFFAFLFFKKPEQLPYCAMDARGEAVSNYQIDGRLQFVTGGFAVRGSGDQQRFIASCRKGTCKGPFEQLKRQEIGRPVHAEFCGSFLTLVVIDGAALYKSTPPSQAQLNAASSSGRGAGAVILTVMSFILLLFFWMQRRKADADSVDQAVR